MPTWILLIQWISRAVLLVLICLSIWSVAIMIDRRRVLKEATAGFNLEKIKNLIHSRDTRAIQEWSHSSSTPAASALQAALEMGTHAEAIDRAVRSMLIEKREELEQGLTVLATLGSNAPFIGLFGTVLGIIQAFGSLSEQQRGTSQVMSGISEALVATAVGLFVAIPAVVAYNYFSKQVRDVIAQCESLRDLYIAHLKRAD